MTSQDFIRALAGYLARQPGWAEYSIVSAARLDGGISRDTWKVILAEPGGSERGVIFRLDPPDSLLESNRHKEAAICAALASNDQIPVPTTIWLEDDPSHLGATFIATELLPGTTFQPALLTPAFRANSALIARRHFEILGHIARESTPEREILPTPSKPAWLEALDHWEGIVVGAQPGPLPITSAAIRHLRRSPPTSGRLSIVHGDFRLGNLLFQPDGTISAVLDWEMAHLGDPLEDLAWAMHDQWRLKAAPDKVAGILSEAEAIEIWEQTSGMVANPADLHWWRLFACVKCIALWLSGARQLMSGKTRKLHYLGLAWYLAPLEERTMLNLLGVSPP